MALVNRDKDVSERRYEVNWQKDLLVTAISPAVFIVPWPCKVVAVRATGRALSGAPTGVLQGTKFIVGTGNTILQASMMAALTVPALGTSGLGSASLAAAGSTQLQLDAGQVLQWTSAVANTAIDDAAIVVVLEKLQDIVSDFGL